MEKYENILIFDAYEWPVKIAILINKSILSVLKEKNKCSVMLTGGHSAAKVYEAWSGFLNKQSISGVTFYLGDERCVPGSSPHSNYGLIMKKLFKNGIPDGCDFISMDGGMADFNLAAISYEKLLPKKIDIMLLSLGEDGHIASIFPNSRVIEQFDRLITPSTAPVFPLNRLTVTPRLLRSANQIYVMAIGGKKSEVFSRVKLAPLEIADLPARLVPYATWIFDRAV